jgi:hypothetical protein
MIKPIFLLRYKQVLPEHEPTALLQEKEGSYGHA